MGNEITTSISLIEIVKGIENDELETMSHEILEV
jgi:hypothetical protein